MNKKVSCYVELKDGFNGEVVFIYDIETRTIIAENIIIFEEEEKMREKKHD